MLPNIVVKPLKITGKVTVGNGAGRTIGFPTANLDRVPLREELRPGVYLGHCNIYDGDKLRWRDLPCLPYFGPRYVLGQEHDVFEIYIYNFDHQIYNHFVEVTIHQFIREPMKIKTLEELKVQLELDKQTGLRLLHPDENYSIAA